MTLTDEIIDCAEELAEEEASSHILYDVDIVHRLSQMVQEHLYVNDKYGKLAIGAYRHYERKIREQRVGAHFIEALVS